MTARTKHEVGHSYDLHIGVSSAHAEVVQSMIFPPDADGDGLRPVVYRGEDLGGSSWEEWGEGPWSESDGEMPPDIAEHVLIRCTSVVEAFQALVELRYESIDLVPMRWPNQRGTIAVISRADDWAEQYLSLVADGEYADLVPKGDTESWGPREQWDSRYRERRGS